MLGHRRTGAIWAALALTALLAAAVLAPAATAKKGHKGPPTLEFRGQAIIPTGTTFMGTTVGGLSSISYAGGKSFYVISDDQANARFYKLRAEHLRRRAGQRRHHVHVRHDAEAARRDAVPDRQPRPRGLHAHEAQPEGSHHVRGLREPADQPVDPRLPARTAPTSATFRCRRSSTRTRPARRGSA